MVNCCFFVIHNRAHCWIIPVYCLFDEMMMWWFRVSVYALNNLNIKKGYPTNCEKKIWETLIHPPLSVFNNNFLPWGIVAFWWIYIFEDLKHVRSAIVEGVIVDLLSCMFDCRNSDSWKGFRATLICASFLFLFYFSCKPATTIKELVWRLTVVVRQT